MTSSQNFFVSPKSREEEGLTILGDNKPHLKKSFFRKKHLFNIFFILLKNHECENLAQNGHANTCGGSHGKILVK